MGLPPQLRSASTAIDAAYAAMPASAERVRALKPLQRQWITTSDHMFKLQGPRTPEGIRAVAKLMLDYSDVTHYSDSVWDCATMAWLSRACAEYLAGQAVVMPPATSRPIGDESAPLDPMDLLSHIAGCAMEAGADPSAPVSPDHELLMMCDAIVMLKRQGDDAFKERRDTPGAPLTSTSNREAYDLARREKRALAAPLRTLGKMRAVTPAGIFAKAVAVRRVGSNAAGLGNSLADDILNSAELRQAIWPSTKEVPD